MEIIVRMISKRHRQYTCNSFLKRMVVVFFGPYIKTYKGSH